MLQYTERYKESKSDIQNNDFFYKIHPKCQNAFEFLEFLGKTHFQKIKLLRQYAKYGANPEEKHFFRDQITFYIFWKKFFWGSRR